MLGFRVSGSSREADTRFPFPFAQLISLLRLGGYSACLARFRASAEIFCQVKSSGIDWIGFCTI